MNGEQSQALPVFLPPFLVLKGAVWPGIEWGPRRVRFVAEACEGTGLLSWNIHVQWGVGRLLSTKTWAIFSGFICWGRLTNNQIWRLTTIRFTVCDLAIYISAGGLSTSLQGLARRSWRSPQLKKEGLFGDPRIVVWTQVTYIELLVGLRTLSVFLSN